MEAMTKHRSHSAAFKRQVAEEFIAGETLHALSKRHDISRQLIQEYEARIAELERLVGCDGEGH
jgi:transposase-like protein